MKTIEIIFKTALGAGPVFCFDLSVIPRVGDEVVLVNGQVVEVTRVILYPADNRAIVFTR